jgi:hypothetical protein
MSTTECGGSNKTLLLGRPRTMAKHLACFKRYASLHTTDGSKRFWTGNPIDSSFTDRINKENFTMRKTKSKETDDDVSETEKGNAVSETVKKLGTDQLEQLQRVVKAELRARDGSDERDAESERLSKMSDGAFRQMLADMVDASESKKSSKTED